MKRGVLARGARQTTFKPCAGDAELPLVDQSDGEWVRAFWNEPAAAPSLYVEAFGERAAGEAAPEGVGSGAVFVLEQVLYAAPDDAVRGCAAASPEYIVAARGVEPFWAAEVFDGQIVWRSPEAPMEIVVADPRTEDSEGAVRYFAANDAHELEVLIEAHACRDAMSGEFFAYTAQAQLDGRRFSGCARLGR